MSASYRVSKADVEASRLVFVMLKDAKPMRKVAIPIMEGMSFHAFEGQVRTALAFDRAKPMRTWHQSGTPTGRQRSGQGEATHRWHSDHDSGHRTHPSAWNSIGV